MADYREGPNGTVEWINPDSGMWETVSGPSGINATTGQYNANTYTAPDGSEIIKADTFQYGEPVKWYSGPVKTGTKLQGRTGYYRYKGDAYAKQEFRNQNTTNPEGSYDLDWTPYNYGLIPPGWEYIYSKPEYQYSLGPDIEALYKGGIYKDTRAYNGWKKGLSTFMQAYGPMVGAFAGGLMSTTGELGGQSITLGEAVQNGATASDLASMGFTEAQIASSLSGTTANSLTNMGMNQTLANTLTDAGAGAIKSAGTQLINTGSIDPTKVLYGAAGSAVNSGINTGVKSLFGSETATPTIDKSAGGTVMDEYDFNYGDYGAGDLYINPAGSDFTDTSGGWDWLGNVNWGQIATPLIGAGISAIQGASAAGTANNQANTANNAAIAAQGNMYQQQRADFAPYRQLGEQGVQAYTNFSNNPGAFLNTPAYAWQAQELDRGMNRSLSALGRSNSSYGMNERARGLANLAVSEFDRAYNRLLDPIKIGQGAANSTGAATQQMSQNYGQYGQNTMNNAANNYNNTQNSLYGSAALGMGMYNALKPVI